MTGVHELRTNARWRLAGSLGVMLLCVACSSPTSSATPGTSAAPIPSNAAPPTAPLITLTPLPSPTTAVVATPAPTGTLTTDGFRFDDILKVQVNSLSVRVAPIRTARLVHQYLILGTTASDLGEVHLNKGDQVKVQIGPVRIGDTTWYLVWPAHDGELNDQITNWYDAAPLKGQPVPAWIAASVNGTSYMTLQRRPTSAEIEAVEPVGLLAAGAGNYTSPAMPRHDAFQLYWAAAAATSGTSCSMQLQLVPDDADFGPLKALDTTTTTVKIAPLNGMPVLWPAASSASWSTFTLTITGTCRWAVRLIRNEHD
ncbi:MAG TPA: hypothetical protein VGM49_06250 [Candidatus Limnocylindrales bacterium]